MRIGQVGFEGRRLELNRREVNELYRKNKTYHADSTKKRMISILENLINEEKDNNPAIRNNVDDHLEITLQEQNLNNNEDLEDVIPTHNVEEKIETLEEVRKAALSSPYPSLQDLRIAIEASNQLQLMKGKLNKNNEDKPQLEVGLLERLKKQIFIPNEASIQDSKDLEQVKIDKEYQKAISKYKNQMKLAENNFENETSKYSLIA